MVDSSPPMSNNRGRKVVRSIGATALLLAMATDAFSVAGRHFGFPFVGSIEIVELCIVVAATAALTIAAIDGGHARVRIVVGMVSIRASRWFDRLAEVSSAVLFAIFAAGSIWMAADMWNGYETTELLGIPLRGFRVFWIGGCLICTLIFAFRAVRSAR